jgi:hypothetical protein
VALHLAPEQVWGMDPIDFVTVVDELSPPDPLDELADMLAGG